MRRNPGTCGWCGARQLRRHHDARKAADGLKYCSACGMTQSPHATVKGSYACLDKQTGRIVTGVRKNGPTLYQGGRLAKATKVTKFSGEVIVKLYNTIIFRIDGRTVTLNSGGYRTMTTQRRINQSAKEFGIPLQVKTIRSRWAVVIEGQEAVLFEDGMSLTW